MSSLTDTAGRQVWPTAEEKAEEDDVSLILLMADKEINQDAAEAALATFFSRHQGVLKGFAIKNKFQTLGFDPDDFVLQTFEKVYERAGQFDAPSGLSPEALEKKVRAWIFEIAKNEFFMELRKLASKTEETTDPDLLPPPDNMEELILTGKAAAVRTFLDALPEDDRQLLETSMNFYDHIAKRVAIPADILAGLAMALRTTSEGLKQRRKRLLRKLKEHLETT